MSGGGRSDGSGGSAVAAVGAGVLEEGGWSCQAVVIMPECDSSSGSQQRNA